MIARHLVQMLLCASRRHARILAPMAGALLADFVVGAHVSEPALALLSVFGHPALPVHWLHALAGSVVLMEWLHSFHPRSATDGA